MKTACEVLNLVTCPLIINNNLKDTSKYGRQFTFGFQLGQIEALKKVGLISKEEYLATKESLKICEPYIPDFTSRREKNINVFFRIIPNPFKLVVINKKVNTTIFVIA